jgi:hypothetical protein
LILTYFLGKTFLDNLFIGIESFLTHLLRTFGC